MAGIMIMISMRIDIRRFRIRRRGADRHYRGARLLSVPRIIMVLRAGLVVREAGMVVREEEREGMGRGEGSRIIRTMRAI